MKVSYENGEFSLEEKKEINYKPKTLRNKEDIDNYYEKYEVLKRNGWSDLWHCDNWVKNEWFNSKTINVDRAGCSMDTAYNIVLNNLKVNDSTQLLLNF